MPESDRPICTKCCTPMWKKQVVFPQSKNPRQLWICGKCGKTRSTLINKEGGHENTNGTNNGVGLEIKKPTYFSGPAHTSQHLHQP